MKPFTIFPLSVLLFISLKTNAALLNTNDNQQNHFMLFSDTSTKIFEGKIIKSLQINKVGRKLKIYDYFFVDGKTKKQYFIKSSTNTTLIDEIEKHIIYSDTLNNETKKLKIKGKKQTGLWDSDNPEHQSRVGDYIHIYEILKDN